MLAPVWFRRRFLEPREFRKAVDKLVADPWGKMVFMYLASACGEGKIDIRHEWTKVLRDHERVPEGHEHMMSLARRLVGILDSDNRRTALLTWYAEALALHCNLKIMLLSGETVAQGQAESQLHRCMVGSANIAAQIMATSFPQYLKLSSGDVPRALQWVKIDNLKAHFETEFARYAYLSNGGTVDWMPGFQQVVLARIEHQHRMALGQPCVCSSAEIEQEFLATLSDAFIRDIILNSDDFRLQKAP